jgi:hypothetical protein
MEEAFQEGRKIGSAERAYWTVLRETGDRRRAEAAKSEILGTAGDLPNRLARNTIKSPPPVPKLGTYLRDPEADKEETDLSDFGG